MWKGWAANPGPPASKGPNPAPCTAVTLSAGSRDPAGRRQGVGQDLQLGQAPADGVCDGDGTLGAHQAVPEVDRLHLPQGRQRLQEEVGPG